MRCSTHPAGIRAAALAATFVLATVCCFGDTGPAGEVMAKLQEARQAQQAVATAQARGDAGAADGYRADAERLMEEAAAICETVLEESPNDPSLLLAFASVHQARRDFDLAEEVLRRALAIDPKNAKAWLALGKALGGMGESKGIESAKALRRASELSPRSETGAEALGLLGVQYWTWGLYEFAGDAFSRCLEVDEDNTFARIGRIALDLRQGKMREGSDAMDKLGRVSQEHAGLLDRFVREALDGFMRQGRWLPDNAADHLAYAKCLTRAGMLPDSVLALERATTLDPSDHIAWNLLGSVNAALNQTEEARKAFAKSLEIDPNQPRTEEALRKLDAAPAATSPSQ